MEVIFPMERQGYERPRTTSVLACLFYSQMSFLSTWSNNIFILRSELDSYTSSCIMSLRTESDPRQIVHMGELSSNCSMWKTV